MGASQVKDGDDKIVYFILVEEEELGSLLVPVLVP